MPVEWQADHKLLGDEKPAFERELSRLGLGPSSFLVVIRREPGVQGAERSDAIRYSVYITDIAHPEYETCKLEGGHGRDWIGRYSKIVTSHR